MTIGLIELAVLRELAGVDEKREHVPAAFVRALQTLRLAGYLDKIGNVTPDGTAAIHANEGT